MGNERRAEEALNVLAEALAVASQNGDQMYEAEIYRIKGELLRASSRGENRREAESCFRRIQGYRELWILSAALGRASTSKVDSTNKAA